MTESFLMSDNPQLTITIETIAQAEQLIGLSFTDAEREQMSQLLNTRLAHYDALRSVSLPNDIGMALQFQPDVTVDVSTDVPRTYAMSPQDAVTRPDNLEDVAFYPITKLAQLLRTRQVTSVELTEMYIARLKRYNPVLECVVTLTEDLAFKQARRADDELQRGYYRSPLHGIPWGAKDLLSTKDYKTSWGAMPFKDQQFDIDATVVERLEQAGAVLVAKLTMGALASGDVWFGGVTKNPWNVELGSGGSSAGPASATAAGLVGFAIGTETMGSIVNPSTRCGLSGLRPTFGRVSRYGAMALSWSMDKIGPMCRSVEDCALVFSAIYGADNREKQVSTQPFTWNPAFDPHQLRVGYLENLFAESDDEHISKAALPTHKELELKNKVNDQSVLADMKKLGFDLIPKALPDIEIGSLFIILIAEAAAAFDELTRSNQDDVLTRQDASAFPNLFRAARLIPAVEYIQANRVRTLVMQEMARIMQDVDVIVAPTFGDDVLLLTNMTGHPAVVVPNGFADDGTPTSITFIGGLYKEAETLAVAKAYQDATGFHLQHPTLNFADNND